MKDTLIPWTDHTFNTVWVCIPVSPGCKNCYAKVLANRWGWGWGVGAARRTMSAAYWDAPLKWDKAAREAGQRHRVFVGSMCDWAEDHPTNNHEREKLWPIIRQTPSLDWLLLTKRPENITRFLPDDWGDGYPNVWLMTSVENQHYADMRIPILLSVPAAVHAISAEPLLGPVELPRLAELDWVIVGGESGPGARPFHLEWAEQIQRQCEETGTAFFMKQTGANAWGGGQRFYTTDRKGEDLAEWPDHLQVRQFPACRVEVLLLHEGIHRKPVALYSLEDHDGGVHGECCKECIPEAEGEEFTVVKIDGKEESDVLLFCNWCNVPLMMTPTEYCIERYLGSQAAVSDLE